MADDFEVMPDYLAALELELRARARALPVSARWRRAPKWRGPAFAVALAALVLLPAVLIVGSIGDGTRAYGKPAILATTAVKIPAPLKNGLSTKLALGDAAGRLTEARPIHAFHNTAYLLSGHGVWCLSAPDPKAREPLVERIATCTNTHELLRIGISLEVGDQFVAAIPDGVQPPVLSRADGTSEVLMPDKQGVVKVDHFKRGDSVTLHGTNGQRRIDHAR